MTLVFISLLPSNTTRFWKIKKGGLITLDFSKVLYLDSAALGMVVLLKKRAKANGCDVEIASAKGTALEVLEIANFDKMVTIRKG